MKKGPRQSAIDIVDLMREIESRSPKDLPGDLVAAEIEIAAAGDIIDSLHAEIKDLKHALAEATTDVYPQE